MRAFRILIITFSVFSVLPNARYTSAFAADPPQGRGEIFVGGVLGDFMRKLAFEEEKEEDRDWYRLRGAFYGEYGHSPLSFEEVLGVLNTRYLAKITHTPDYRAKLKEYEDLPFPVIWKLLDRKKPVRVYNLDTLFFHTRPDPENKEHAEILSRIQFEHTYKARKEEMAGRKDNRYFPDDTLMYIKLSLLDWLKSSIENEPDSWPGKSRKNAADKLERMYAVAPDTAEKWYLKEGARRTLLAFADKKDASGGMKTPVWETAEFLNWLKQAEKDHKLLSRESKDIKEK